MNAVVTLTPMMVRSYIKWLMTTPPWSQHLDCLARVFGWPEVRLHSPTAAWITLELKSKELQTVSHRLRMILSGEIEPTAMKRVIPGGIGPKGRYAPRETIEWQPARRLDPKPLKPPLMMGVQMGYRGSRPRVVMNVPR